MKKKISAPLAIFIIAVFLLIICAAILWEILISCQKPLDNTTTPTVFLNDFIIVSSLAFKKEIESPVSVKGRSNTFEANVRIRITDDDEKVLADTFTMGGAYGEMKPFSLDVVYDSPSASTGIVEVFEDSTKDGTEMNKITVPVIFQDYSEECTREGESACGPLGCKDCCSGLIRAEFREPMKNKNNQIVCKETGMTVHYCIKCGDGACDKIENWCVCPEDCQKPDPEDLELYPF
ncbi:MAG: Gmad2 immunoglobulin-like domain-containing protein [Patescibacteria group bacterium]|nr:Gmad2 immunoglobulin-like domain-containing protein [Patescibacteria group bacterium]